MSGFKLCVTTKQFLLFFLFNSKALKTEIFKNRDISV